MYIGIDFDNTIACYDEIFYKVALEQGVINSDMPVNKIAIRDYLRGIDQEPVWTEMQGYVYGKRMSEASAFPGVVAFIAAAVEQGHVINIISHKTQYPVIGLPYDLHAAARGWINENLVWNNRKLFSDEQLFFELTRDTKLAQIERCGCDCFIDDLPEILTAQKFPKNIISILFDPEEHYSLSLMPTFATWQDIGKYLGIEC
ncbi:haloacid dehalogenase-like hydrolase [Ectothiorhodospiraceae bacterium BW-2]|nr:haloacid dehalogenase-like hydrolase [Ectothiorhodospiraceae bacterium BW-2]